MATIENPQKYSKFASGGILECKEIGSQLIISGYIATTHKDSDNDIILKETLDIWAKEINEGVPKANKVTYHHDRTDKRAVGVGQKESARVDRLPDGEYGLFVNTIVNKSHDLYSDIEYEYSIGTLDSFSIEFTTPDGAKEDSSTRILGTDTELYGWTLASRPVNDNAVMIKEMVEGKSTTHSQSSSEQVKLEEKQMSETEQTEVQVLQAQLKELQSKMIASEEAKAKELKEAEDAKVEEEAAEAKKAEEEKESKMETQMKELKEAIAKIGESSKAKTEAEEKESKILPEYKELKAVTDKEFDYKEAAFHVGAYLAKRGLEAKEDFVNLALTKENTAEDSRAKTFFKSVEGKERIQFKSLSLGDNINSNYVNATTDIGLSQAELQDVVMPVIFNALNESTVTYDLIGKETGGSDGSNRVVFVLKIANTGAYFSTGNAIVTTTTQRQKYSTEYKKLYIGGAVDGDLQVYSRGAPFGEALALEIADRAIALKVEANQALYDENVGEAGEAEPLGIPAITDSAGNTSLYNTTRSAANKLAPDSAGDTYVDGSAGLTEPMLRNAIEQATTDGSMLDDLIFVGTPAVINKYKALFDNKERLVPYSPRAGFKNAPDFEGVPLFGDKDAKASSLFLIDMKALRAKIVQPATVEMLGKRSDSHEFFMKQYYAIYCTAPRRLVEIYSIA
jgi:hypothetical protein